jgi:hypothetical protein
MRMLYIGRVQRRLVIALGASLALHAWLMQSHYGKGAVRGGATIAAQLLPAAKESNISRR